MIWLRLPPTRSLRGLLAREITAVLAVIWLLASGFILLRTWVEVQDAYLDQVEQLAHVLASVLDEGQLSAAKVEDNLQQMRDRNYFIIVEAQDETVMRTARALDYAFAPRDWHVHKEISPSGLVEVTVGLRREEPVELVISVGLGAAAPLLLGLLATLAMIWLALGRGLRPLDNLRRDLVARRPEALSPLSSADLPEELRPVVQALNDLLARLDQALSRERRFVADASHELRTPLTAIRAQLDILDPARLDPVTAQALARVSAGADRASRLIGQLLALARADAGVQGEATPIDTVTVLSDLAAELYPQAVKAGKELDLELVPAELQINREDLEMLVGNLLENAIHHSRTGARLTTECEAQAYVITVEDDGPGVPESERRAIFERFRRGTARADKTARLAATSLARGAGLGLSIVAAIVDRLGATLTLSDTPGGGLRIRVQVPFRRTGSR